MMQGERLPDCLTEPVNGAIVLSDDRQTRILDISTPATDISPRSLANGVLLEILLTLESLCLCRQNDVTGTVYTSGNSIP